MERKRMMTAPDPMDSSQTHKLFVGNLSWQTSPELVRTTFEDLFEDPNAVVDVEIVREDHSNRSLGYGFVTMKSLLHASKAIVELNGHLLDGRPIKVATAVNRFR